LAAMLTFFCLSFFCFQKILFFESNKRFHFQIGRMKIRIFLYNIDVCLCLCG
jgi:hypothetical protein